MIPKGFLFSSLSAGIKKNKKKDLGIIVSNPPSAAAAVFTKNRVKAAPVALSEKHLASPRHRAVICNSGCANALTGKRGLDDSIKTARVLARQIGCGQKEILVASTGTIAPFLPMKKINAAIPKLAGSLSRDPKGFCRAIMTTDTKPKSASKSFTVGGKKAAIWGCAKGAGMIRPDMATMLAFIITDAAIPKTLLQAALRNITGKTFNRITVDDDTSTNDSVFLLANGLAKNAPIKNRSKDYGVFCKALFYVCDSLALQIVSDAEGATRIAEIKVEKAKSEAEALKVARSVSGSLLVKTALHGADPNWGRIIAAAGYSGAPVDDKKMELYFGPYPAFKKGKPARTPEHKLAAQMRKNKVEITLVLNRGTKSASCLFSDISRRYVSINADYRT